MAEVGGRGLQRLEAGGGCTWMGGGPECKSGRLGSKQAMEHQAAAEGVDLESCNEGQLATAAAAAAAAGKQCTAEHSWHTLRHKAQQQWHQQQTANAASHTGQVPEAHIWHFQKHEAQQR